MLVYEPVSIDYKYAQHLMEQCRSLFRSRIPRLEQVFGVLAI